MRSGKLSFCLSFFISLHSVGRGNDPQSIEEYTLLWDDKRVRRDCRFNTEEEIDSFLKRLGIDPLHVRRTRETISDYGFVRVTVICPRPAGNSFLFQYRLYDDEGGSCVLE